MVMRVATFGEAMLRFSPPAGSSLEKADEYRVEVAGAEANVAVALARLGVAVTWISRLPRNDLGRRVAGKLREHGVDPRITWADEGRVGLYFVELGVTPRPPHVIYDRAGSAFARLCPDAIDEMALDGADLFHVSGITPAISSGCREATMRLVGAAHRRGIDISFDVNYRAKLSSPESAREVVEEIAPMLRFLFISSADARFVLGVDGSPQAQAEVLHGRYLGAIVIVTAGAQGAYVWDNGLYHRVIVPGITIDRFGRGDAFCAGYLLGRGQGGTEAGLAYGAALASLAQTYAGDLAWVTYEDVLQVIDGAPGVRYR